MLADANATAPFEPGRIGKASVLIASTYSVIVPLESFLTHTPQRMIRHRRSWLETQEGSMLQAVDEHP